MTALSRLAEWGWYSHGASAAATRALLTPASWLYAAVVARRNTRFDRAVRDGTLPSVPLPALSVGNVTVGGTGKTPVASWFASRLRDRGARPTLVLRGYGDDEWRVHRMLTPDVPVVRNADRVAAMYTAQSGGADCVVLDDAFQHRRARRVSDVVLVSADRALQATHVLPAGPYREPLRAIRRATALVITVKAASDAQVAATVATLRAIAPTVPHAVVRLQPDAVRRVTRPDLSEEVPGVTENTAVREWCRGRRVVLVSAIADALAFEAQVVAAGAQVVRHHRFPDHHDFQPAEVRGIVAQMTGASDVVCTLKDAVKLAPQWPREAPPLWYVSQTLVVDRGAEVLEQECDRVLAARMATIPTAG